MSNDVMLRVACHLRIFACIFTTGCKQTVQNNGKEESCFYIGWEISYMYACILLLKKKKKKKWKNACKY